MYILLNIKCARKYDMITRESAHEFSYCGYFTTRYQAEQYIEEKELTMCHISDRVGPGILLYTVGTNPDYYILLDINVIPEYPVHIGRLTVQ